MLKEYLDKLEKNNLLVRIKKPVSVKHEIASVMRTCQDRALLFENVSGFGMPVVANICSTRDMVALGLGVRKEEIIRKLTESMEKPQEPDVEPHEYQELPCDLGKLPVLTYYKEDGGPYIASAIFFAKDKELGINASYHRMMVLGKDRFAARLLPRHFRKYLERGLKEFAICIGNPVEILVSSAMSPEAGKSELSIGNALRKTRVVNVDGHVVPEAEIVMIAEPTGEKAKEGPFLDLTETFDIVREEPVFRIKKIYAKKNPVFHALLPGGLEHKILMGMPKEPTIFSEVSRVCRCRDVLVTPGGCSWLHGAVSIEKAASGDGKKAIDAAFRGHKSMKHVIVVDDDIDIHNPAEVEWAIATRFQGDRDAVIRPKEKGSSLDPSSDLETRETTKVGIDATIPWGRKPEGFRKPSLPMDINIEDYVGD
jgi:2,5-furandicarboxylate decarboxylase 1